MAAALAVELTKRRVSVAFAEYEVASAAQVSTAIAHGLACHRGGVVLWTKAFERLHQTPLPERDRLRVLRSFEVPAERRRPDGLGPRAESVKNLNNFRV